jgi:F-type H+-transporting ATPase subunit epsilon
MAGIFEVEIITPEGLFYSAQAVSLIAPAELGYLGVLANHAPLVARLTEGKMVIRDSQGKAKILYCASKGFLQVLKNKVSLIFEEHSLKEQGA